MVRKGRALHQTEETALRLAKAGWFDAAELCEAEGIRQTSGSYMLRKMTESGQLIRRRKKGPKGGVSWEYTLPDANLFREYAERPFVALKPRPRGRGVAIAKEVNKTQRLEKAMAILFPQGIHDIQGLVSWMDLTRELMNG